MSLLHWWTFNNETKDRGLLNKSILGEAQASMVAGGKVGGYSARFANNTNADYYITNDLINTTQLSFSIWLKLDTTQSGWGQVCKIGTSGTAWTNIIFGLDNQKDAYLRFTLSDGSSYTGYNGPHSNASLQDAKWHHIAATYDNGVMRMFVDGVETNSSPFTTTIVPNISSATKIIVGSGDTGEGMTGNVCDFRIYNHALSVKEVKELSKGLMLHYNFEDEYIEPTTNLITDGNTFSSWSSYGFGSHGTKTVMTGTTPNGINTFCRVTDNYTNTSNASIEMARWVTSTALTNGGKIAFSTYVKGVGNTVGKTCFIHIYNSNGTDTISTNIKSITLTANWQRIEGVFTWNKASTSSTSFSCYVVCQMIQGEQFDFCEPQFEANDHNTPYVNGTRSAGKVYDNSGYSYSATLTGDCQIISDTKSGQHSLLNNSTNTTTSAQAGVAYARGDLGASITPEALTVSFWANVVEYGYQSSGILSLSNNATSPSDYQAAGIHQYDYKFAVNLQTTSANLSSTSLIEVGAWHHYAIVYNGTNAISYKDGVQVQSVAGAGAFKAFRYVFLGLNTAGGGWRKSKVKWGDFKLYATALSAADVLAEYNRKAAIDRNGNLFTGEYIEGTTTKIKINKNDLIVGNNFIEGTNNVKLADAYTQLEYIENTGTTTISTGYQLDMDNDSVEIEFQATTADQNGMIFANTSGHYFWLYHYNGSGKISLYIDNGSGQNHIGGPTKDLNKHTAVWLNKSYYVDNVYIGNQTRTLGLTSQQIFLFAYNAGGSYPYKGKIFRCKIWNNAGIQRDLIPAKRNSDNVIGMYDLANRKFYAPTGSGTFTAGPTIGSISTVYANKLYEI